MFPTPDSPTPPVRLTHLSLPRIYTSSADQPPPPHQLKPPAEGYPRRTPLSASPPGMPNTLREPESHSVRRWHPYASPARNSPPTPSRAHMALPLPAPWRDSPAPSLPPSLSRLLDPAPFGHTAVRREHKAPPRLYVFPPRPSISPRVANQHQHQYPRETRWGSAAEDMKSERASMSEPDLLQMQGDEPGTDNELEGAEEGSEAVQSDVNLDLGVSANDEGRRRGGIGTGAGVAMVRNGRVLKSRMSHILSEQRRRESISTPPPHLFGTREKLMSDSGFDRLRSMLPLAEEGMTKAQILQQASDYILKLESRVADLVSRQYGRA